MTITQDSSAPLIVVVGSTGTQGGSVIKALSESDRPYRIRGITRDPSKPSAQALAKQGVEVVSCSVSVDNRRKVYEAFNGATYAFAVTNYGEHADTNKETDEGNLQVDAAHAAKVKLLIWSGLIHLGDASGGKYKHVEFFDGKARVTRYAKEIGVPMCHIPAGMYMYNFTTAAGPVKNRDGSYVLKGPGAPDSVLPMLDPGHDYGLFVRAALESPTPPEEVLAYGEEISLQDMAKQLGEITGKNIPYVQVSNEEYMEVLKAKGLPEFIAVELTEMYACCAEYGYYGKHNLPRCPEGLGRPTRTWAEYVKATDWSKILA